MARHAQCATYTFTYTFLEAVCYKQEEMKGDGGKNITRQRRVARGECAGGCGKLVSNRGLCAECRADLREYVKTRRKDLVEAGLCPQCGKNPLPQGVSRCLKCGLSNESYEALLAGDVAAAYGQHTTYMRKLGGGVSPSTKRKKSVNR